MKEVNQNDLVDAPHFRVLFSQLQQQPADTGERSCHFQQRTNNGNIVAYIIVHNEEEHEKTKEVMRKEWNIKVPEEQVGEYQTTEFENEKPQVHVAQEMGGNIGFRDYINMKVVIKQKIPQAENDRIESKQPPHHCCCPKYFLAWA